MAFICVFFPAVIMCGVRKMVWKGKEQKSGADWKRTIFEYVSCCVFLNLLLLAFLALFRQNTQDIYEKLNMYSNFAMKYLLSSVFLAVAVPFVEKYLRENVSISVEVNKKQPLGQSSAVSKWISRYGIYVLGIVAIGMHFVRIFDNVFWGDEIIPLTTMNLGFREMLQRVAGSGHTPLHYAIILVLYRMFGPSGPMYHFASLFPYIVIVVVTVTIVRKWFGKRTAAILVLLSALLENAVRYNVEVRMYSWCQMFIFLAYLMMYQILRTKKTRYFVFMSIFSLGALYSHSFAVAAIGILYLFLFAYVVWKDGKAIWKVLCSGGMTLVLFLLWMLYGYHVRGQFVAQYGLQDTSWRVCFEYIFSSKYSLFILLMFVCVFLVVLLRDTGIAKIKNMGNQKKEVSIFASPSDWTISYESVWLLAGVTATFGTIVAAEWFSHTFYPIITLRYLYPAFILVWLAFGICISKCRAKKLLTVALSVILAFSCIPAYLRTVKSENDIEKGMENTLAATDEILQERSYIMTNINHLNWNVIYYYYPGAQHDLIDGATLPQFHKNDTNWLFLDSPISEDIEKCIKRRGYSAELVVSGGYVGTYKVWIYKLVK